MSRWSFFRLSLSVVGLELGETAKNAIRQLQWLSLEFRRILSKFTELLSAVLRLLGYQLLGYEFKFENFMPVIQNFKFWMMYINSVHYLRLGVDYNATYMQQQRNIRQSFRLPHSITNHFIGLGGGFSFWMDNQLKQSNQKKKKKGPNFIAI